MKKENNNYPYYKHDDINNLKELLTYKLEERKNDIAFLYKDKENDLVSITYLNFYNDVTRLSDYLYNKYKNKNIALISENNYFFLVYFMAITISGNVALIIDKDSDTKKIKELLKKGDSKVIFASFDYLDIKDYKNYDFNDIKDINKTSKKENKYIIKDDDSAVIFYTSGTTGPNKGVVLTHKNIASDIVDACSIFKLSGSVVAVLPFHHAFGLITSVLKPFYYGYPVYINKSLKYITNDLKEQKPETLFFVPLFVETFYRQIWKTARKEKKDKTLKRTIKISNGLLKVGIDLRKKLFKSVLAAFGGNLSYIICGGAYLDKKYVKWFRSIGIEILNGYGITECSPVLSVNRNNYYKDGSVGVPVKDIIIKIIDNEICVKGNIVMKGYYKDAKSTKDVIKDGYFHTGDFGYLDSDGFLFITGRKKNLIILSNGENVSPEAIEEELLHDESVCEVIAYASDNKIKVTIFPNEEYLEDQEYFNELISKYNRNKAKNQQIADFSLRLEELPKNSNKKILRNKVMEEENER